MSRLFPGNGLEPLYTNVEQGHPPSEHEIQ